MKKVKDNQASMEELVNSVDSFFAWEKQNQRLEVLKSSVTEGIVRAKRELLSMLRDRDIYVLERGALEDYYPMEIKNHGEKPAMAQEFCKRISSKEDALALCGDHCDENGSSLGKEFELICAGLFQFSVEQVDA